jgi:hypothetical protein
MRRTVTSRCPRPRPLVRWTAAGCALLVWVLGLLAASPKLHSQLHADAGHAQHTCAVTIFHQGVEDTGAALPQLVVAWRVVGDAAATPAVRILTEARGLLPPSCGPPVG